jgi:ribonucleoside-triphosphate reductase (thioredoxin)
MNTLQAGYTDFKFLSPAAKECFEKEALIGVSVTGWMDNPKVLFDTEVMNRGAEIVKETNKRVAKLIGINQAARTTCVKPSGNASVLLGTGSGIHGQHSKRYLRHVQFNIDTEIAQLFIKDNPHMVETSVWSANGTDVVVAFPIVPTKGSILKNELLGVKQLEYVKKVQQNWVENGTNVHLCRDPRIRHNVSNTITVDDWDEVTKYVFDNKESLCGISFLSARGDKAYPQAPNTEILDMQDIINKYGTESLFTSALIEHSLRAYNQDLWAACTLATEDRSSLEDTHANADKLEWLKRFDKFSKNFKSKEDCVNCLKDVYNLHKVWKINDNLKQVDWTKIKKPRYTEIDTMGAQACAGGQCEI